MAAAEPFVEFPRSALDEPIGALFERQAARSPERLAVKERRRACTYRELDAEANRLAHAIRARCGAAPEPVALLYAHDAPAVAAILAVLKLGKIYVVLDPHLEAPRLQMIAADAGARLLVCDAESLALARAVAPAGSAILDASADLAGAPETTPGVTVSSRALAAIAYTSGSTGEPKGVVTDHREILHRIMLLVNGSRLGPDDRHGLLQSIAVSASYRRVLGPLLVGASVFPFDLRAERADALGPWLIREQITICAFAASVFRHLAGEMSGPASYPSLRRVWLQSEPVVRTDIDLFRRIFPAHCELVTGLATSEAGIVRELIVDAATPLGEDFVPVGYPVPGKDVVLLDEDARPVATGETGEIVVRSEFLPRGYWRRPELDSLVYGADANGSVRTCRTGDLGRLLPDGCLVLLGRKDARTKLNGRFVDTARMETALLGHPGVRLATVVIREDRPGHQRLVAYIVPGDAAPAATALRAHAQAHLGDQPVPSAFVFLEALPRTANGKVDRRALPVPDRTRPELSTPYRAPASPVERAVAAIWAEALDLDAVGLDDNFLELGGTSLLAGRIAALVSERLTLELSPDRLMALPRVEDMALAVVAHLIDLDERDRLFDSRKGASRPPAD